jgi:hypothetical protein
MVYPTFKDDFGHWGLYWLSIFMIVSAISWAVPFYISFVALNIWGAFIHRKLSILFSFIGVVFVILTVLSLDMYSYYSKTDFP